MVVLKVRKSLARSRKPYKSPSTRAEPVKARSSAKIAPCRKSSIRYEGFVFPLPLVPPEPVKQEVEPRGNKRHVVSPWHEINQARQYGRGLYRIKKIVKLWQQQ